MTKCTYGLNLLRLYVEYFCDLLNRPSGLQIGKHRLYRHSSSLEDPGTTHLARNAFDSFALRPIEIRHCLLTHFKITLIRTKCDRNQTAVISRPLASRPSMARPASASATTITVIASTAG